MDVTVVFNDQQVHAGAFLKATIEQGRWAGAAARRDAFEGLGGRGCVDKTLTIRESPCQVNGGFHGFWSPVNDL
jgi:hypothetical protein